MVKLKYMCEELTINDLDKYVREISSEFDDVDIESNTKDGLFVTITYNGISEMLSFSSEDTEFEVFNTIRLFVNNIKSLLKSNTDINRIYKIVKTLFAQGLFCSKVLNKPYILWNCSDLEESSSFSLKVPCYKFSITFYYMNENITSYFYNDIEGVHIKIGDDYFMYRTFHDFLKIVVSKFGFNPINLNYIYFQQQQT